MASCARCTPEVRSRKNGTAMPRLAAGSRRTGPLALLDRESTTSQAQTISPFTTPATFPSPIAFLSSRTIY